MAQVPGDERQRSSIPWLLLVLNAPRDKRHQLGYASVLSIIGGNIKRPGQKHPDPLDHNHMLSLIKDELAYLEKYGTEVYDAAEDEFFTCYVKCVAVVSDYRGYHKLLGMKVRRGSQMSCDTFPGALSAARFGLSQDVLDELRVAVLPVVGCSARACYCLRTMPLTRAYR